MGVKSQFTTSFLGRGKIVVKERNSNIRTIKCPLCNTGSYLITDKILDALRGWLRKIEL